MAERTDADVTQCERLSVTVDVVIFALRDGALQVLLVQRRRWPYAGLWAIPGSSVRADEPLEHAAHRGLARELGIGDPGIYLEQLCTFGTPDRDPRTRVIAVGYLALVPWDRLHLRTGLDTAVGKWFPAYNPPSCAFDHADILAYAIRRLRYKLEYTALAFRLLPETFTLTELQEAYECILDTKLDKRNFRRKVLSADILEETPHVRVGGHRPARLYHFRTFAMTEVRTRRLFP